jgi:hypothetical protein
MDEAEQSLARAERYATSKRAGERHSVPIYFRDTAAAMVNLFSEAHITLAQSRPGGGCDRAFQNGQTHGLNMGLGGAAPPVPPLGDQTPSHKVMTARAAMVTADSVPSTVHASSTLAVVRGRVGGRFGSCRRLSIAIPFLSQHAFCCMLSKSSLVICADT